jgi:histidinol-phosphate aminotransferase
MSRFFDLINKPARELGSAPLAARNAVEGRRPMVRLDSNESPYGPSPLALEAIRSALQESNLYPDNDSSTLRALLAEQHGLAPDQVIVTAGSTALIGILCQTMLGPGLNAVAGLNSFIVYSLAVHAAGADLIQSPMKQDGLDLEAMLAAVDANTRLIFLANPNNPTGTLVSAENTRAFLNAVPGHVVVVLDEAYFEYANFFARLRGIQYSESLRYVKEGRSVVVLRTFSKTHGLAGLRVGFGMGPAELLSYCTGMRNTYSVSSIAQVAALAALGDQRHIRDAVSRNASQAELLSATLSSMGFRITPTFANFIHCEVGREASALAQALHREGISIRPLGSWGLPNSLRISIGSAEQNRSLVEVLRRVHPQQMRQA